jgi:putative SOS response-associated peptidase YedK
MTPHKNGFYSVSAAQPKDKPAFLFRNKETGVVFMASLMNQTTVFAERNTKT